MDRPRSRLTALGRALVAAAVALALGALVLREPDLFGVAALLGALPAVAGRPVRPVLRFDRPVEPLRLAAGDPGTVRLTVTSVGRRPTGVIQLEDTVPTAVGASPRFVLDRLAPHVPRELRYEVAPRLRGRYRLGPLRVWHGDPLGLVTVAGRLAATTTLVVRPVTHPLHGLPPGAGWSRGGVGQSRAVVAGRRADETGVREYRRGDELRRVHWRSTARTGSLMVRREEPHRDTAVTLVLDTRRRSYPTPEADFEWAVVAAASIATHLCRAGLPLRLTAGEWSVAATAATATHPDPEELLDLLAGVRPTPQRDCAAMLAAVRAAAGPVVALLGVLDAQDSAALAGLAPVAGTGVAIQVGQAQPAAPHAGTPAPRAQALPGWRVVPAAAGDDPAVVWDGVVTGVTR